MAGKLNANCRYCSKTFKLTKTQRKRGRRFCTWDCFLKQRAIDNEQKKVAFQCATDGCNGKNAVARGLCGKCYQRWNLTFGKRAKWIEVECEGCGSIFPTAANSQRRRFCSQECYTSSDFFKQHRKRYSEEMESRRILFQCLQCGAEQRAAKSLMSKNTYGRDKRPRKPKRFCDKTCYRAYFAERFDRAVAAQTALQTPCSYDEFMSQKELPCLIDGCDWFGDNLAMHTNVIHGINAKDLKALAGFNRGTGLVSPKTAKLMSERAQQWAQDNLPSPAFDPAEIDHSNRGAIRAEGREHHSKAVLLYGKKKGNVED